MLYEGFLLLRTPNMLTNTIYVVEDGDNFVADHKDVILRNVNSLTRDYVSVGIEFVDPRTSVSDNDLRIMLKKRYNVPDSQLDALVAKSRGQSVRINFWDILREDDIRFKCSDSKGFNAFIILAFSTSQYQIYRFCLHSEVAALDLGRLIFNEYDYMVRPKSFGFQGFSGWPQEMPITTTPSPNVGVPLSDADRKNADMLNRQAAMVVDAIKDMDREDGISWLRSVLGDSILRSLDLQVPEVSGLRIDSDMRLLLTDRNDAELKIDPLTKAYYYMHLIHPEGVSFRYVDLYEKPILETYKIVSPRGDVEKLRKSVCQLLEYASPTMPQKISRLRRRFMDFFPKSLIEKYYIPKYDGDEEYCMKRISLSPEKIEVAPELDCVRRMSIDLPPRKRKTEDEPDDKIIPLPDDYMADIVHHDEKVERGRDIYILS